MADALLRRATPIDGAVLLVVIAFALHPNVSGHPVPQTELREIGTLGMRDHLVHGTLFLLLGALLTGAASYALRRGLTRKPVVAGLVCFAAGIGSLLVAGLTDGFILPAIDARFVFASPAEQSAAVATLTAMVVSLNIFSSFAIVAMAIAFAAWRSI